MIITKSAFDWFLSSGANRIPSFDQMARAGIFHVESARPSVLVSNEGSKDKEVALYLKVNHGKSLVLEVKVKQ